MVGASQPFIDWSWISDNSSVIRSELWQHIELTALAVGIGLALSLPLGVLAWRVRATRPLIVGVSAALYTVPSIALFALMGPLTGYFSITTAEAALVGYTLLILIRNTIAGLDAVPDDVRETARGMGYSQSAQLLRVDLPLALPAIFAGLRVATATTIGLVAVTAFIGQGGLGQLLITGFQESFNTPIVVGLALSIALAGVGDLLLVAIERLVVPWARLLRAG
jgi:osmoprotectant transport system permease protein